jgi:hypothetical protein
MLYFFTFYSILARALFLIVPDPVVSSTSASFCQLVSFVGLYHMGGTYTWGTCIAIFRVLFVLSQDVLKNK